MTTGRTSRSGIQAAALLSLLAPLAAQAQAEPAAADARRHIAAPAPADVLRDIYLPEGAAAPAGEAVSYDLGDGREAVWWHGESFEFGGQQYFTGTAYLARGGYDPEGGEGFASIGQATYRLGARGWELIDSDGHIGGFALGRISERAAEVDDARRAVLRHETGDGRLLLAVPVRTFAYGIEHVEYELFVFDPAKVDPIRNGLWAALGTVHWGENNAADCGEEFDRACWSMEGVVSFVPRAGGLPDVKVSYRGSRPEAPDQVRKLGPDDFISYSYDPDERGYVIAASTIAGS